MRIPDYTPLRSAVVGLLVVAAAYACDPAPAHADPIKPTHELTSVSIEVKWGTPGEVAARCAALGAWGGDVGFAVKYARKQPIGCAQVYRESKRCVVHAPRPEALDDERTLVLGHEVLHCFIGEYHSN